MAKKKRTISIQAVMAAVASPRTPAGLKKGLIKKYRKQLQVELARSRTLVRKLKQRNPGAAWHHDRAHEARRERLHYKGGLRSYLDGHVEAHERSAKIAKSMGMNPRGGTVIYDQVLRVEARKGKGSLYKGEKFFHNFGGKTKAKIIGMPDGSLRIVGNKPLWKPIKQR